MNRSTTIGAPRRRGSPSRRGRTAAIALAVVMLVGLLISFMQVLAASVAQAELRRRAIAEENDALWRCRLLRTARSREACVAQLHPARTDR